MLKSLSVSNRSLIFFDLTFDFNGETESWVFELFISMVKPKVGYLAQLSFSPLKQKVRKSKLSVSPLKSKVKSKNSNFDSKPKVISLSAEF